MMKFKSFMFGLFIVGLVAAIYASPKTIFLKIAFKGSAAPYNTLWNGTSDLASLLSSRGYIVVAPLTSKELGEALSTAGNYSRVIYAVVSPDEPLDPGGRDAWLASMLGGNGSHVSVLIADENTTSNPFLENYGVSVSGKALLYGDNDPFPRAVFRIPGKCVASPGLIYSTPTSYTEHVLWLDWASYINILQANVSKPCVIGTATAAPEGTSWFNTYVVGLLLDHSTTPIIGEGNTMLVVSDGSLFINSALRNSDANYTGFALDVFKLLSRGSSPGKTLVILDATHYYRRRIINSNGYPSTTIPLPLVFHPAMLIVVALYMWRGAESWFYNYLWRQPLVGFPVVVVASLIIYGYMRSLAGVREVDDTIVKRVEEVGILAETPVRVKYAGIRRIDKREALRIASDLYRLLDHVLEKSLGIGLEEILADQSKRMYLSRTVNMGEEELAKALTKIKLLKERSEGSRKLTPIIIRWDSTARKMIRDAEKVLEGLGYTLISRSEKYRRLEYGVRGLF